ncbi:MAG: 30S ribosomal protein S8 [Puniceicoccaceae bacterium]|nr:MAG: 30S ribosomal protein S8 [Puniceicoccaceae bacterium]
MTDPISDFLTRIRNASSARLPRCVAPHSKLKLAIAKILVDEGFLAGVEEGTDERGHKTIVLQMKYVDGQPALAGLTRVSKPGRRIYSGTAEIPKVLNGLGISILSTSRGLKKDRDARREKLGGEVLCNVW